MVIFIVVLSTQMLNTNMRSSYFIMKSKAKK